MKSRLLGRLLFLVVIENRYFETHCAKRKALTRADLYEQIQQKQSYLCIGLDTDMKVHFLAFGILIYLLPVVVQRIDEIEDVYFKTVYTLGANSWQTFREWSGR